MAVIPSVRELLGWTRGGPNMADSSSATSRAIASGILEVLEVTRHVDHVGQTAGKQLEEATLEFLAAGLPESLGGSRVDVSRKPPITEFAQYRHLATLKRLIDEDETQVLKASVGTDYLIKPDVTVGLVPALNARSLLHAAVPCKWTLRSDRAQNVRHEAVILIRHRRGRLPHITPVTAEPLPTRLASLARGTGEVDTVYHVALDALREACGGTPNNEQIEVLEELESNDRLRDLSELAATLST